MKTKKCYKCKQEKDIYYFWKSSKTYDGYDYICKECKRSTSAKQKAERILLVSDGFKLCCKCDKEKTLDMFYNNKIDKSGKDSYCKQCMNQICKNYYNKNRKKQIKRVSEYFKYNLKTNINFKLKHYLRTRLNATLNGKNKSKRTLELLGCSIDFLRKHLESQFKLGMTWNNHGRGDNGKGMQEWQIDHIIPCAIFDLSDPKQQEQCFHYTNLQPLWADENRAK
jgi:hypothetical protein